MSTRHHLGMVVATGALAALASAQTDRMNRSGAQDALQASGRADSVVASWLIADNEKEIALARLAQQRAKDGEVKAFAERMVREHEQFLQRLRGFEGDAGSGARTGTGGAERTGGTGTGQTGTGQTGTGQGGRTGGTGETGTGGTGTGGTGRTGGTETGTGQGGTGTGQTGTGQGGRTGGTGETGTGGTGTGGTGRTGGTETGMGQGGTGTGAQGTAGLGANEFGRQSEGVSAAMVREIARRCGEAAKRDLEARQGEDFDRTYMTMAVIEHNNANEKLAVFASHVSERLRPVIAEGQATVQQHLEHAKQIARKLQGGAARPEGR